MKMDAKILHKILLKWTQENIQRMIHYNKMGFIFVLQVWFNICKSMNMIHHINKHKDEHIMNFSIDGENTTDDIQP